LDASARFALPNPILIVCHNELLSHHLSFPAIQGTATIHL
jgi:hypothetical protein